MNEILDSHEKFPTHEKLSCKKDFFVLFEYMEENPIGILFKQLFFYLFISSFELGNEFEIISLYL